MSRSNNGKVVRLTNGDAWADVAVYGSTVIGWHPASASDPQYSALFLSQETRPRKPFRGGIPLVFPVFGEPKDHAELPDTLRSCTRHGFCRDREWTLQTNVQDTESLDSVTMSLSSDDDPALLEAFPFAFTLEHTVTLAKDSLECKLRVQHGSFSKIDVMPFQALFHDYLSVPSGTAKALGLKGTAFVDKLAGGKYVANNDVEQQGWSTEIDRVYQGGAPMLTIDANDDSGRQIVLERSKTLPDTTLWNPGKAADENMGDLHAGGWKEFVCAEPGHVTGFEHLERGKEWIGSQKLSFRRNERGQSQQEGRGAASKAIAGGTGAAVAGAGAGVAAASTKGSNGQGKGSTQSNSSQQEGDASASVEALHKTVSKHYGGTKGASEGSGDANAAAARVIQRNYRAYVSKREQDGQCLSSDARWGDAFGRMRLENASKAADSGGKNDANSRWKRGGVLVGQLAGSPGTQDGGSKQGDQLGMGGAVEGGPSLDPSNQLRSGAPEKEEQSGAPQKTASDGMIGDVPGGNDGDKVDNIRTIAQKDQPGLKLIERWTRGAQAQELSKIMEAQYWLEMVDRKHRYGSNLKHYHAAWDNDTETKDNFFKWLDEGRGKDLDLSECPRERLDSEMITYLSAEQRANYVVDVKDGLLVWRRNGKPVDTTKNRWRDLGDGRGIVELGPEEKEEIQRLRRERATRRGKPLNNSGSETSSSSSSSSDDDDEDSLDQDEDGHETKKAQAAHYGGDQSKSLGKFTTAGLWDRVLRKTVSENTWIYVFNSRHELFIGLKKTGKFQHSSFLYGGRVLSAGLLRAKDGYLTSLSPLSGHYRAGTAHFRYFVASLQDSKVNLDHVTLSKSLLMLRGLEAYGKMNKKAKSGFKLGRKKSKEDKKDGKGRDKKSALSKDGSTELPNQRSHTTAIRKAFTSKSTNPSMPNEEGAAA